MWKRKYEPLATEEEDGDDNNESSHSNTCFLSELSISWMNSIFEIGSKRPLNQSDFLPLRDEDRTRDITERLQDDWDRHVKECRSSGAKQPKLWKCLVRMISWGEISYFMSFFFAESLARVTQPLVLAWIIHLLSSSETQQPFTYVSCLLLSLSGLSTACTHFSSYRFELLGMRLRSALKGIVYLKVKAYFMFFILTIRMSLIQRQQLIAPKQRWRACGRLAATKSYFSRFQKMGRWSHEPWRVLNRTSSNSNNLTNRERTNSLYANQSESNTWHPGTEGGKMRAITIVIWFYPTMNGPIRENWRKKITLQLIQGIRLPSIQLFLRYSAFEVRLTTHSRWNALTKDWGSKRELCDHVSVTVVIWPPSSPFISFYSASQFNHLRLLDSSVCYLFTVVIFVFHFPAT